MNKYKYVCYGKRCDEKREGRSEEERKVRHTNIMASKTKILTRKKKKHATTLQISHDFEFLKSKHIFKNKRRKERERERERERECVCVCVSERVYVRENGMHMSSKHKHTPPAVETVCKYENKGRKMKIAVRK